MVLPATATLAEACAMLAQLGQDTDVIDASAMKHFDTSVIALLLEARRRAEARGTETVVHGAPPKLRELAKLYGVEELLSLAAT
jgi:phospholipid transport system transporter-binding protein